MWQCMRKSFCNAKTETEVGIINYIATCKPPFEYHAKVWHWHWWYFKYYLCTFNISRPWGRVHKKKIKKKNHWVLFSNSTNTNTVILLAWKLLCARLLTKRWGNMPSPSESNFTCSDCWCYENDECNVACALWFETADIALKSNCHMSYRPQKPWLDSLSLTLTLVTVN